MVGASEVTLLSETIRHIREQDMSGLADIWRHEGLKKGVEKVLYICGMHESGRAMLETVGPPVSTDGLATNIGSVGLDGPVGIAPGWDKTGNSILGWQSLGAHHITVGGVTLYPQAGNDMPRLFTFDNEFGDHGKKVSINRYGFYNPGADKVVRNIARQRETDAVRIPIFVQITANKGFYEEADQHLLPGIIAKTVRTVLPVADGISFGLSSPHTPGMRESQAYEFLYRIISTAQEAGSKVADRNVPYILKGDGDGGDARLDMYCRLATATGVHLELINTTTRSDIKSKYGSPDVHGGLAGADGHYQAMANHAVRYAYTAVGDKVNIIGNGGINSTERAKDMIKFGASALGINTAVRELGLRAVRSIESSLGDSFGRSSLKEMVGWGFNQRGVQKFSDNL